MSDLEILVRESNHVAHDTTLEQPFRAFRTIARRQCTTCTLGRIAQAGRVSDACVDLFPCQEADDDHPRTCERLPLTSASPLGSGDWYRRRARFASSQGITLADPPTDRPFCRQSGRVDTATPCHFEPRPQCQCDRRRYPLKSGQTDQRGSIYAPWEHLKQQTCGRRAQARRRSPQTPRRHG